MTQSSQSPPHFSLSDEPEIFDEQIDRIGREFYAHDEYLIKIRKLEEKMEKWVKEDTRQKKTVNVQMNCLSRIKIAACLWGDTGDADYIKRIPDWANAFIAPAKERAEWRAKIVEFKSRRSDLSDAIMLTDDDVNLALGLLDDLDSLNEKPENAGKLHATIDRLTDRVELLLPLLERVTKNLALIMGKLMGNMMGNFARGFKEGFKASMTEEAETGKRSEDNFLKNGKGSKKPGKSPATKTPSKRN